MTAIEASPSSALKEQQRRSEYLAHFDTLECSDSSGGIDDETRFAVQAVKK
jgi:hypothetical protein